MRPPGASEGFVAPPDAAVARFRDDLERLTPRARDAHRGGSGGPVTLAVSGGPDSMAMLALAAAALPGRVLAATFDHRLREGSAGEARMVAGACAALGVSHTVLTPAAPIAGSSLQRQAREARYAALRAWALGLGDRPMLLTAHHADDQAETLLMRLNRASGLAGLSAIRPARFDDGMVVLRPLLAWRRADLRAIVQGCGLPFVDDPSNGDPRHDRTRVRTLLAERPDLDAAALAASAGYLGEAEEAIAHSALRLWSERWDGPSRSIALDDLPRELRRRLVRRAILEVRAARGIVRPPFSEASSIEPLLTALESGRAAVHGGVKVWRAGDAWRFEGAPPRRSH